MNAERWQQVKEILDRALQKSPAERSAFVGQACVTDPSLQREVESLLASRSDVADDFMKSASPGHLWVANGAIFGSYEMIGLIGAGGMGEVYRARDRALGRDVAIKVLPSAIASDPERLRRFEQEARAAAALNHPNILAIHQMGIHEGGPYLVMELLEGCTLREQLIAGPVQVRTAVDHGAQIARGLSAAHERGIVHRDLKPENLFLTKDGRVKILDFGLAKLTQRTPVDPSAPTVGTDSGVVMGTVGYMSPEQVRGQPADHRADIFAFGAILYEVLTGERAFRKPTSIETMGAILKEDPASVSVLAPAVPVALQKIVQRCLEKNPERRFQSAADLAFALEGLSDSGVSLTVEPRKPSRGWAYTAIATVVVAAALVITFVTSRPHLPVPVTGWEQLTDFADSVTQPAFSPDGRMLTFLRGDDTFTTTGQVYVMLLPHGTPVRLTNDSTAKMSPVFSPDGANIAYTVPWDTWTVPVLGGQPQLWLPNASGLTWLASDKLLFSQINTTGNHMDLVRSDLSRAHVQPVYSPESLLGMAHRSYPSPDHKWVIGVEMGASFWNRCRLIPFDGSTHGTPIGPTDGACTAAAWSPDGQWMYFNTNSGHGFHISRQRFPNGEIQQVTSAPTEEEGIAFDPDGKSIVTSVGIHRSSVWLHDSHGDRVLTSESAAGLANTRGSPFSPDGKKLYYILRHTPGREVSTDAAVGELWEIDLQSGATHAVMPGFAITDFSLSPDGRDIAFSVLDEEKGTESLWLAALDRNSSPRMLQPSANRPRFTTEYIYYVRRMPEGGYVHRMHPDGSGDEQIWQEKIMTAAVSPDGRYIALTVPTGGRTQWMLQIVDWAPKRVHPICNDAVAYWSDDGRSFFVTGWAKRNRSAPGYLITLATPNGMPELPANGLSDTSQLARLKRVRTITAGMIALGRSPDTYAYVKETVQRNLYRIPLR